MADEPATPPKKGKRSWMVWAVLALVAIGAGAALPWVFGGQLPDLLPAKKHEPHASKQTAIPFDDVVVNIGEEKNSKYLRVKLMIAVEEQDAHEITELVTKQKAFLKSWLICHLSDQSVADVTRRVNVSRIRREIRNQFNEMLFPNGEEKVQDILFDMFVVQQQ